MTTSLRLATAKTYINLFASLVASQLETILAEDYYHEFAPLSMNPPGPFDKRGFLEHYSHLKDIMSGFPVTAKEYVESEASNAVTVHATSETIFREEVRDDEGDWEYHGEYVFMLYMNDTGDKVVKVVEFLDSKATVEKLIPLNRRAKANLERRKPKT